MNSTVMHFAMSSEETQNYSVEIWKFRMHFAEGSAEGSAEGRLYCRMFRGIKESGSDFLRKLHFVKRTYTN
jgi:hypothetical protein